METLLDATRNAFRLVASLDPEVLEYAGRSLYIALAATFGACLAAIPAGVLLAEHEFRGKRVLVTLVNTLMGVPTVVVGLVVYAFISAQGPLGTLGLLFTVDGIIIGEMLLVLPLMTALTLAAVTRTDRRVRLAAVALGASRVQALWTVFRESRFGILAAIIAGFGRVVGEVGVAMILGGNVDGFTRTLTTATILNISSGYFELALALGIVLLLLSFVINIVFQLLQGRGQGR